MSDHDHPVAANLLDGATRAQRWVTSAAAANCTSRRSWICSRGSSWGGPCGWRHGWVGRGERHGGDHGAGHVTIKDRWRWRSSAGARTSASSIIPIRVVRDASRIIPPRGAWHPSPFLWQLLGLLLDRQERARRTLSKSDVALFDYIEVFYNQRRRHSTLGQISPAAFERQAA